MRYDKIAARCISLTVLIGALSIPVSAAPEGSETSIGFEEFSGVTDPKDPDNPENEGTETGTGQNGPLSLDYVPDLTFGAHTISSTLQVYNTTTNKPYIQVTDLRGTGAGWRVSTALSNFSNSGIPSLNGAALLLTNGSPISTYATSAPAPIAAVTLESDNSPVDIVTAGNADGGQGRGTWLIRWYPAGGAADVQLRVPAASASVGTHTATITWTLYDAP